MSTENLPITPKSSSKFRVEKFTGNDGIERTRIVTDRVKFGWEEKLAFLEEYKRHGLMGKSARVAGVSTKTVREHIARDPDFGAMCVEAETDYHDRLIEHHQDLLFNGTVKKQFDRNGKVTSEEQVYPIPLILAELKKHDEGYRDKKELRVDVTGGVLIAPAEVASIDDWESRFSTDTIEGIATEVVPSEKSDDE